nr:MAG TPA: hypothetical protein [Caudoviricetes sp.]
MQDDLQDNEMFIKNVKWYRWNEDKGEWEHER